MMTSRVFVMLAMIAGSFAATIDAPVPVVTELSGSIDFSAIDKPIAVPEVPDNVKLTCRNCSTSGTLSLLAGGFNVNDSDLEIAQEFFSTGFLKFQASGMTANVSLDLALLSGSRNAQFKVPLFSKDLLTLSLGGLANIDIGFQINAPITALLNSEADIFAGFTLSVPDGSGIHLYIGSPSNSYMSGFDKAVLTPLPLDASIPNLDFSALTGLEFVLTAKASANPASDSTLFGNVAITLNLPTLKTTASPLMNVNSACGPPKGGDMTYQNAVHVAQTAQLDLDLDGQFNVDVAGFADTWSPDLQVLDFVIPLPNHCLEWNPIEAGLVTLSSTTDESSENGAAFVGLSGSSKALMTVLAITATAIAYI